MSAQRHRGLTENLRCLRTKRERLDHYLPHLDEVGT
ncbi:hypothetical protein BC739_006963 [Kutzneria viridogrisea]|uniref:Uncharacterized protein n=1 Tax=Kutzneria viridogrisea TaxID=47990 RepID=A0ABR6BSS7_9PSEU|nr:hypothetical protein [Kutzneria viridogrisea]